MLPLSNPDSQVPSVPNNNCCYWRYFAMYAVLENGNNVLERVFLILGSKMVTNPVVIKAD